MSSIVLVRHPVPATYVPKGCRNERGTFRRHRTPVRLREVGWGEAIPLDQTVDMNVHEISETPMYHRCVWHGGRVWAEIGGKYEDAYALPMYRDEFVDWLEAESDGREDRHDGRSILVGTPLMGGEPGGPDPRGSVVSAGDVRREGTWDPDRGSQDLLSFLEDRVLLIGGVAHLRLPGPIWVLEGAYRWSEVTNSTLIPRLWHLPVALNRLSGCCEMLGLDMPLEADGVKLTSGGDPVTMSQDALGLEDVVHFANAAPSILMRVAGTCIHRCKAPDEDLMEPIRALRAWRHLAEIGAVRLDEAAGVADAVVQASGALARFFPNVGASLAITRLAAYASRYVLPLVREPEEMDAGDLAALDGLGEVVIPGPTRPVQESLEGLPLFAASGGRA